MNPCKTMDADLYLKSKREDVGGGSIKLIYPREVKVTMEFHSQSMLSLGEAGKGEEGPFIVYTFDISVAEMGGYLGMTLGASLLGKPSVVFLSFFPSKSLNLYNIG